MIKNTTIIKYYLNKRLQGCFIVFYVFLDNDSFILFSRTYFCHGLRVTNYKQFLFFFHSHM